MQKLNRSTGDRAQDEDWRRIYRRTDDLETAIAALKGTSTPTTTPTTSPVAPLPPIIPPAPGVSSITSGTGNPLVTGDAVLKAGTGFRIDQAGQQFTLNALFGTYPVTVVTAAMSPYVVLGGDFTIFADTTAGDVTIQFVGGGINTGRFVLVVNTGTGTNSVNLTSSPNSVIGITRLVKITGFTSGWYQCDGTNWYSVTNSPVKPVPTQVYSDASVPGGNTISNTSSEVAFTSAYTIPANTLVAGQSLRLKLYLIYNCIVGSQVVELKVKIGSQTVLDTGLVTLIGPMTNGGMAVDADLFVTAIGASGSIEAQGASQLGAPASGSSINLTNTAPYTVNTTINEAITFTWQFTTANAGNNVTLRAARVEILQ